MKKILVVIIARGVGGLEKRFATLYSHLAKNKPANFDITFLVSKAQLEMMKAYSTPIAHNNIHLDSFGFSKRSDLKENKLIWRLGDYLSFSLKLLMHYSWVKYDVIHYVTNTALHFRFFLRTNRQVFSFVDAPTFERILYSGFFKKILHENFIIDCLSKDLKQKVVDLNIADSRNLYASPCSFTDYSKTSVVDKKKLIVFLSRLDENKGVELLASALPGLCKACPGFQFKILGHGTLESWLRKTVADNNLTDRVSIGFHINPVEVLRESMILLSLQKRENYPSQALLEAMACGNAVVATNVGLTHLLVTPETGILINTKEELVQAVEKLASNPELAMQMGRNAREKVMREHTVERFADYLLNEVYSA